MQPSVWRRIQNSSVRALAVKPRAFGAPRCGYGTLTARRVRANGQPWRNENIRCFESIEGGLQRLEDYSGRNPATGEQIVITASKNVAFRPMEGGAASYAAAFVMSAINRALARSCVPPWPHLRVL